jgi:thiosulfate/3-mercaptopyruvate sulfurtransferase
MLPSPEKVERLIGGLGIDNRTHVVLIPEGRTAADLGTATRIYWTFKVMGHDLVSILDGGFQAWIREADQGGKPVNPLATDDPRPAPRAFKAAVRREMLIGKAGVQEAMAERQPLVDNRPYDFFVGLVKSSAAKVAGTIPGARSLPEGWLTVNGGGQFRPKAQLEKLYAQAGVPTTGKQVTFCNTGHWASLGWFVGHELLGNKDVKLYDGSMAEWTHDASLTVERKVKLE